MTSRRLGRIDFLFRLLRRRSQRAPKCQVLAETEILDHELNTILRIGDHQLDPKSQGASLLPPPMRWENLLGVLLERVHYQCFQTKLP